jgi:uncharacterized protein (UPF0335 family)
MAKAKSSVDSDMLARFLDRIEILVEERAGINASLREIYDEVREVGMDAETVRQMVKEKALDPVVRQGQYDLRDEYRRALGLYADTPLGEAAMQRTGQTAADVVHPPPKPRTRKPRPFAEQPVHPPLRVRKRKTVDDAFAEARAHLGSEPAGTA